MTKPTVEQALIFKRLSQHEWYGIPHNIIKECLFKSGWNEVLAKVILDTEWRAPEKGYWCARWGYRGGADDLIAELTEHPVSVEHGIHWTVEQDGEITLHRTFKAADEFCKSGGFIECPAGERFTKD